jgi:chorismate-pyruvate lyase
MDVTDRLYKLDLPTCLRICAGTDGSVTHLLELMTKIFVGEQVNERTVLLRAGGVAYVYARSLAPIRQMPEGMEEDLMRADIPIGRIMKKHNIESRREIVEIGVLNLKSSVFGEDCMVLSRIYRIIHDRKTLIWINEMFPIDDRWSL